MIAGSLSRRYARALLAIGQEERQLRRILTEAERFAALLAEVPGLRETLSAAQVTRQDKRAALEALLGKTDFLPVTRNFLLLLVEKGRMGVLPQIVSEMRGMVERLEGIERVEVTVPAPLSGPQRDLLRDTLAFQTGKKIELEEKVEPSVLGGIVVKVGSTVYDGSVRTHLTKLRESLQKG